MEDGWDGTEPSDGSFADAFLAWFTFVILYAMYRLEGIDEVGALGANPSTTTTRTPSHSLSLLRLYLEAAFCRPPSKSLRSANSPVKVRLNTQQRGYGCPQKNSPGPEKRHVIPFSHPPIAKAWIHMPCHSQQLATSMVREPYLRHQRREFLSPASGGASRQTPYYKVRLSRSDEGKAATREL